MFCFYFIWLCFSHKVNTGQIWSVGAYFCHFQNATMYTDFHSQILGCIVHPTLRHHNSLLCTDASPHGQVRLQKSSTSIFDINCISVCVHVYMYASSTGYVHTQWRLNVYGGPYATAPEALLRHNRHPIVKYETMIQTCGEMGGCGWGARSQNRNV